MYHVRRRRLYSKCADRRWVVKAARPALTLSRRMGLLYTIARAIARGRVFVSIRYPQDVANMEDASFTTEHFRHLLIQLQQVGCC